MGHYLPDEAIEHFRRTSRTMSPLEQIVAEFPVRLKQAMYAAAELGSMRAGTWNGCAFNKAGYQLEQLGGQNTDIQTYAEAARAFDVSQTLVERFITVWDSKRDLTDSGRTSLLKRVLTNVGISTPPDKFKNDADPSARGSHGKVVVINETVYKGEQTKFIEALEKVQTLDDLGFGDTEVVHAEALVAHLVSA